MQIGVWSHWQFLNIPLCTLLRILGVNLLMRVRIHKKSLHCSEAQLNLC